MKTIVLLSFVVSLAFGQYYAYPNQQTFQPQQFQPMYQPVQPIMQQQDYQNVPVSATPTPATATPAATEQCSHGACCSSTKTYLAAGEPCRATTNPCEDIARCNGQSAECPENPKKDNTTSCMLHGQCTDGFCTEYECVGLCCTNGVQAQDGTACGAVNETTKEQQGKCIAGTCTVYRQVDPHVTPLTEEEKQVIQKAQKQVKGELEALLRSHAKYIIKKEQFNASSQKSALEKIEASIGVTDISSNVNNLKSDNNSSTTSTWSWSSITIIVGLALIAVAVVIIFVIKPKDDNDDKARQRKIPKKKTTKGEDMTSADYDPPAF